MQAPGVESNTSFKIPAANQTEVVLQANELHVSDARHIGEINSGNARSETFALQRREEPGTLSSKAQGLGGGRNESTASRHTRETIPVMEPKIFHVLNPSPVKHNRVMKQTLLKVCFVVFSLLGLVGFFCLSSSVRIVWS